MLRPAPIASVFCAILLRLMSASFETGIGQSCTPSAGVPGLDQVRVIETGAARCQQAQMAVHRVLIQRNQQVELSPSVVAILSGPVRMVRNVWPPRMMD